jgi:membrane protein implicated in regulation of membrane protease activity
MPWWGWITIGALFLAAEMTIVDLEFYLVFLGASAFVVGLIGLAGPADAYWPYWFQWIVFAILTIASLVIFRKRFYSKLHPTADAVISDGVDGALATATDAITAGARGSVMLRGATWMARNSGSETISSGASCRVLRSEGLVLEVRLEGSGGEDGREGQPNDGGS